MIGKIGWRTAVHDPLDLLDTHDAALLIDGPQPDQEVMVDLVGGDDFP